MNKLPKKIPQNYVDPVKFYQALVDYNKAYDSAIEAGKEPPRIPEYIGKCFLDIAVRLSFSPRFYRYSWKDDLVGDAVENCVLSIRSFKPHISKNAFAYFTQICWFAFFRRNNKEYKQSMVKAEIIRNSGIMDNMLNNKQSSDDNPYESGFMAFLLEATDANASFREHTGENAGKFIKTTKAHRKKMETLAAAGIPEASPKIVKKPKLSKEVQKELKKAAELEAMMLKDLGEVFTEEYNNADEINSIDEYYKGIEND